MSGPGRRPPISGLPEIGSLGAQVGQGRLAMAPPAQEAGVAPQDDGYDRLLAAQSKRASASFRVSRRLRRDQFEQRVRERSGCFLWHVMSDQRNGSMLNRASEEARLACRRIG